MVAKFWLLHILGAIIRCCLIYSSLSDLIKESVEVSTPMNSWKRVIEGVHLYESGINPYSGNIYHETPIGLVIFKYFIEHCGIWLPLVFVVCDFVTALCLFQIAKQFSRDLLSKQSLESKSYAEGISSILLTNKDLVHLPDFVAWMYLFNPYTILNCVGMTTTVFTNFILALSLLCMMRGQRLSATWFLAIASYQVFYPLMLIVPTAMYIAQVELEQIPNYSTWAPWKSMIGTLGLFLTWIVALMIFSYEITNSWDFLSAIYGSLLLVRDLSPNIGLFWYFFAEMFDHFRLFFICTFQINAFIYVIPLAIRLKENPVLLYVLLCCLSAVFKSYPSLGDVGFYLSFMPMWFHLCRYMRQSFFIGGIFIACSVLLPITRYLWLYAGSANSNFYFSITLAFATGQIFLVTDILFAYLKREFHLHNGLKIMMEDKPAKIVLN